MKTWRLPTNIIVNEIMWARPAVRHLFGKYFWDGDHKTLLIGDKTLKQHRAKYHKLIQKKGLTASPFSAIIKAQREEM